MSYESDIKKKEYLMLKIELLQTTRKDDVQLEKDLQELLIVQNRIDLCQEAIQLKYSNKRGDCYKKSIFGSTSATYY